MKITKVTRSTISKMYRTVQCDTHKGIQGHVLIIGGSYGKMGAPLLSSKSALHSGCGLVTAFIPKIGYSILQTALPEVMVLTDKSENYISNIDFTIVPKAIGVGIGMGQEPKTRRAFYKFLNTNEIPLVLDADALNILAYNPKWLLSLKSQTILTPHLKELERLIGKWNSEEEKFEKTAALSKALNCIVVMKGAPTHIFSNGRCYENSTGNPALATAGSGDVLTGIITSLLAQKYTAEEAAILGVYLHGLTADLARPKTGTQAFTASTIIEYLGKAFLEIEK
ncbi:NAD(P)H-hydrate dehydratase [Flavobacterium tegetincola]|uniref:NAD(P)H-hydrate dehydratase n=1 Tax=Flavobacterium tegetincola TaxID=150172 RepID=UPI0003FE8B9F|nr:NAD(P)H-hydrate dehydratase [Flavobacterium tegetincola]